MKKFEIGETEFKRKVLAHLKKEYGEGWWYKTCDKFTTGIPDILGCYGGCLIGIELKVGNHIPTKIQFKVLQQITFSGGKGMWFSNRHDWKEILRKEVKGET